MSTADVRPGPTPPEFLQLAGHLVRWRLLSGLARSDRVVYELTDLVDGTRRQRSGSAASQTDNGGAGA